MTTAGTQKVVAIQEGGTVTTADTFTENLVSQFVFEADVAAETQRSYKQSVNCLINFLKSNHAELSEASLIDFRENLKRTRTDRAAKLVFGTVKKFVSWLNFRGYIPRDCGLMIKSVRIDTTEHSRDSLTLDETCTVIRSMDGAGDSELLLRNKAIAITLFCTGIRLCELTRANVNSIERRRGQWLLKVHGKGRAGANESVILPDEVKVALDAYLAKRGRVNPNDPLFTSCSRRNRGSRLTTQSVSKLMKAAFKNCNLNSSRICAHSTRHTTCTLALEGNGKYTPCTIEQISRNARHKSTEVTAVYLHDTENFSNPVTRTVASMIFDELKGVA